MTQAKSWQIDYDQGATGSVERTLRSKLQDSVSVLDFGAVGDGVADDTAAIQAAIDSGAQSIYFPDGSYSIPTTNILDISGQVRLFGPGVIVGATHTTSPTTYLRIQGSVESSTSHSSAITAGDNSFTVTNTFTNDDLLVVRDFPADATDAFTEGSADWNGEKTRSYANTSSSNLRQTRRKEMLVVKSATGSSFTSVQETLFSYVTTGLVFDKLAAVENVVIECGLRNIHVMFRRCRNVVFRPHTFDLSFLAIREVFGFTVDVNEQICGGYNGRIGIFDSSKNGKVYVSGHGLDIGTDNAQVKLNQVQNVILDGVFDGGDNAATGLLVDTNYTENPLGYTDVPTFNLDCRVVGNGYATLLFATANAFAAAIKHCQFKVTSNGDNAHFKGVENSVIDGQVGGGTLTLQDVNNVRVRGGWNTLSQQTFVDPRGGGTGSNQNMDLSYSGTATPTVEGSTAAGSASYTTQRLFFRREGNLLHFSGFVNWSGHTGTGNVRINLQAGFTCDATHEGGVFFSQVSGLTLASGIGGKVDVNGQKVVVYTHNSGGASSQIALPAAGFMGFFGSYRIKDQ